MIEKAIEYFARRHLLCNVIFILILIGGILAWKGTNKEELPDITFDNVRITVRYPGASAQDVEYLVTKPIEEAVRGLDGVYRVQSVSSQGESSITVELEPHYSAKQEAFTEIRNAAFDVDLPEEVIDDPSVRLFKTSKKAILDIAIIHREKHLLDTESRRELQRLVLTLENQLVNRGPVNSVNRDGYLQEEIQIRAYPEKLLRHELPFNTVMDEVRRNHVRKPAGNLEAPAEPKVTLLSELDNESKLGDLIIQGGFEGKVVRLGEVAEIEEGFEKNRVVVKVNGREGVIMSVVKNSSYGILEALDVVTETVEIFRKSNLENSEFELVLLDDESIDIRNRLSLIGINGTIGFFLILLTLFVFLNKRSGFWVAMGIPFTVCFTLIGGSLLGYTINGTTLAAVIIVMGIVVDDAIVVAENITRLIHQGVSRARAAVQGAAAMALPILASIVTTCIAFVPLFFFTGRYGKFIEHIPPVIFLMLGASLFESLFILPSHMELNIPFLRRFFRNKPHEGVDPPAEHWFEGVERAYGRLLTRILPYKLFVFAIFIGLLVFSGWFASRYMKFVMFPNEETRDIVLMGEAAPGTKRYETARLTRQIEEMLEPYMGKEVVGHRTEVAEGRRGSAAEEQKFRMIVEIVPKEKRLKSADQLVREFQEKITPMEGFVKMQFQKSRRGQDSGSPIELIIQENNDTRRGEVARLLAEEMRQHPALMNVEIDEGLRVPEYRIDIDREKIKRLSIDPVDLASTFRAALEGTILYEFFDGDEDIYVRFSIVEDAKQDIERVLDLPVENRGNYLVPLRDLVRVEEVVSPNSVSRRNLKRTTYVYADMNPAGRKTPLEVAEYFEENIFPKVLARFPSTALSFGGEIQDTRESQSDFGNATLMVILLIYVILAILFNSLWRPLIIMLAIPFGVVGVILAFAIHGKMLFGFYAAVGMLGLAGVVINDSIIMLDKLDREKTGTLSTEDSDREIVRVSQTRLRAVLLTTLTTVAGVLPTAYGFAGYDAMLAEMMLALSWGLMFGTAITLILISCVYSLSCNFEIRLSRSLNASA